MADSDKNTEAVSGRKKPLKKDDDLPSLLRRASDDLSTLLDTKLSLLKVELKEEMDAYIHGGIVIALGGLIAAIGFALLNIAIAFFISTLLANANLTQPAKYGIGFAITSIVYLIIGAIIIVVTKNRLAKQGIVPKRTVAEFEKDKEWLQKEL